MVLNFNPLVSLLTPTRGIWSMSFMQKFSSVHLTGNAVSLPFGTSNDETMKYFSLGVRNTYRANILCIPPGYNQFSAGSGAKRQLQ